MVITAARALHRGESSQIHQANDEVLGVMGADFPLRYFHRYVTLPWKFLTRVIGYISETRNELI